MRTVITGGAGFIGSHLTEYLLNAGDTVTVLDDLSTGSLENLRDVRDNPAFTFHEGSILDRDAVRAVISGSDRVFHLAAAVGVHLIVDHPLESLRTNIHGTEVVLDACRDAGVDLLLASTSEIYGKNTADRLSEDSDRILGSPLKSRWTYAAAKGIDEAFAHAYWCEYGLQVSIVRLFNTVGPRQTGRYGMVVPNLVGQALRGEPLTVYGDGRQTRCFSYVGDVIPAMVRIAEEPATRGLAVNLGGLQEISILDLAERAIKLLGSSSVVSLVPYEEAYGAGYEDMRRRVPDNSLAGRLVRFKPTTTVDTIILKVAKSMLSTASGEVPAGASR
ncbi:NAD-dependent epimerase/dehydratase family protein [Arthrobacter agilis]|uniref:NAD-dependent epimerase/dehydratase family protein n=1 Tax=Arthrobacter agilis TaxID=37921 RepID=UPI00277F00F0|nr:NAD-dependent epimerase/dehydratase family protein [Arthrobacter agilis]MDQ0734627.1 UDP-glucose 4-epimerase [Arthrobacter agilis]